jgi:two-component system nitrogen regulation sensor histidine kinase NtrY
MDSTSLQDKAIAQQQRLSGFGAIGIRRKLQTKVALRLIGICFFGCLTGFLVFNSPYWLAGIWTAVITIGLFYETIRYVDQSERKLTAFLQALRQSDFSVTFSESEHAEDYDLHRAFNQLNDIFRRLRSDREAEHLLLQVVVEHAGAPMICFHDRNDEVYLVNNAAKTLLQIPFLQNIASLSRIDAGFPAFMRSMVDGEKSSFRITQGGKTIVLSATSCHVLFRNMELKLIALHDVSSELAAKEAETWQKLLRVLTHEISNSAIPLSTLSSYIHDMVVKANQANRLLTAEERQDVMDSLKTIDQRSRSLKEFVQNFKSVNQIPEPRLEKIKVSDLVHSTTRLFTKDLEQENISLSVDQVTDLFIYADLNLTQQVLINLIKNAIEAMSNMKEMKYIQVMVRQDGHRFVHLMVGDSGKGIAAEEFDQIFIPFYSTKKGGSGIGLSISQQIMQKQKGDISVRSVPGKGSVFTLTFVA